LFAFKWNNRFIVRCYTAKRLLSRKLDKDKIGTRSGKNKWERNGDSIPDGTSFRESNVNTLKASLLALLTLLAFSLQFGGIMALMNKVVPDR
jgi:hypothetical protein